MIIQTYNQTFVRTVLNTNFLSDAVSESLKLKSVRPTCFTFFYTI